MRTTHPRRLLSFAWRWLRDRGGARADAVGVAFCDACGQVCDAGCRSEAHRRRTQTSVATVGLQV